MKQYLEICNLLRATPNSQILKNIEEDPEFFARDRFSLRLNYLGDRGTRAVLPFVAENSSLTYLNLSGQGLKSPAAEDIYELFRYHPCLKTIDLSDNRIGNNGGKALLKLMDENENITNMNIDANPIDAKFTLKILDFNAAREKWAQRHAPSRPATQLHSVIDWFNTNIEESGSLAPIFTPSANLSHSRSQREPLFEKLENRSSTNRAYKESLII
jgi:hypothetical protein